MSLSSTEIQANESVGARLSATTESESPDPGPPPPRRSTRNRTAPVRFSPIPLISLLGLTVFSPPMSESAFTKSNPIIWRPAKTALVNGAVEIDISTKYLSPCPPLVQSMINAGLNHEFLQRWCLHAYDEAFLKPISEICTDVHDRVIFEQQLIRSKRFIITGSVILVIAAVSVLSIGFGAVGTAIAVTASRQVSELKSELEQKLESLHIVENNQKILEEMMENLESQVDILSREVQEQKKTFIK